MFATQMSYLDLFLLIIIVNYMIIYIKKRMKATHPHPFPFDEDEIITFLKMNGGNHVSHLILLRDKEVFWACQRKVLIVYKRIANKLVVLGDPIGDDSLIEEAIQEFYHFSNTNSLKAIFYQVSPRFMTHYHETGYRFVKLGEEALVKLENFSLEGKQGAKLRTRMNKFARNSFTFSVVRPPFSHELMAELKLISDSWLGRQNEKGFSVVSFSEDYVSSFPIALLQNSNGEIVAFATLATDYKHTVTIDLMRKSSTSPHGTMDVLFIHIFKWAKEKGYENCNLGMAPLANVGNSKHSFLSEKLMYLAYTHGNSLYNFKGLKEFKGKFASSWQPKYLAYPKTFLPLTFFQLLLLINKQPKHKNKAVLRMKYLFKKAG